MSSSGQQRIGFFPHADACAQLVTSEPPLEEAVDSADPDLAAELRAHGIAAESSGDIDKSVSCYAAEMSVRLRIFCDAIQAAPDTLSDETRNAGLEVCRSSESLARQSAAQGADEASIVHINQRALRCAEAALDPDHPVASGIRAHLGDSCMIFAKRCEAQRLGALREPDSSHYDQTETDEWRLKIVHLAHERDGFIAQAIGHYSDAVVRYRVVAALCLPEGSERDTTDPNGAFGTHVCHCLAKIAEAHYLSECASRAEDFQTRAEHEYNVYAERHAGVTKGESSAGTSCPLGWDFSMPYCSGFEYNAASLRTPVDLPDAIGHGCGILAVANQSGVSGDEAQAVLYGHRTWTPSVVEVCDALRETEKIAARLDSARGVAREFMASLRRNDGDWVVILMRHPLVAYVAAVDVESAVAAGGSPATLEELEQATVLVESPFSELIAERYSENLMYYGHLRLYSSLGDREIAKAHGNDWEGCAIPFKVPLLEALYGRNEKAVGVLLDMGHHPLACSPHDMCGALPAAIQAGDLAAAKVLLQHKVVTLHREEADAFELRCERVGVNIESVVSLAPLAESKQRVFGCKEDELTFSLLWELVMALPKSKAASWYAQYADMLLSKLNEEEGSATLLKTAFGASGLLHHLLPDALTRCIALDLVNISDTVLGMVTYNQQLELACKTSDLHLARVLFQTVSVNSIWRDTPVAQYHIDHGNLSILRFINDHPDFDDTLLSKEALAKFDTLVDRWGVSLLS